MSTASVKFYNAIKDAVGPVYRLGVMLVQLRKPASYNWESEWFKHHMQNFRGLVSDVKIALDRVSDSFDVYTEDTNVWKLQEQHAYKRRLMDSYLFQMEKCSSVVRRYVGSDDEMLVDFIRRAKERIDTYDRLWSDQQREFEYISSCEYPTYASIKPNLESVDYNATRLGWIHDEVSKMVVRVNERAIEAMAVE